MKPLKAVLGLGAACAACCAIPLSGLAGGFAVLGSALSACADDLLPAAAVFMALALGGAGAWWWRRRQAAARSTSCNCAGVCSTEADPLHPVQTPGGACCKG